MRATLPAKVAPAASTRLLADVRALGGNPPAAARAPALVRLEAALGREFADRLVAALSTESAQRL